MNLKEIVGEPRAKHCALRHRRNPVPFHPWLKIWVHQKNFRPGLLRVIQIFGRNRLIVGNVRAYKDDQVRPDPIRVRAGRRSAAHGLAQRHGAGRVTNARAGVHVVGANKARHFLMRVISLIGQAARSDVPSQPSRIGILQTFRHSRYRFFPGHPPKSFFTFSPDHRNRQPSQLPQLLLGFLLQRRHIFEHPPVHRRHGVETKQRKTNCAQMDPLHGPVVHAGRAQGAAVATAIVENAPGIAQIVAVFPNRGQHVLISVGMLLVHAIRHPPHPMLSFQPALLRLHLPSLPLIEQPSSIQERRSIPRTARSGSRASDYGDLLQAGR